MALIVSSVPLLLRLLSSEYNLATEGSISEHWSKTNLRTLSVDAESKEEANNMIFVIVWMSLRKKKRRQWNSSIISAHYLSLILCNTSFPSPPAFNILVSLASSSLTLLSFLKVRDYHLIYFCVKDYGTGDTFSFQDVYNHSKKQYLI